MKFGGAAIGIDAAGDSVAGVRAVRVGGMAATATGWPPANGVRCLCASGGSGEREQEQGRPALIVQPPVQQHPGIVSARCPWKPAIMPGAAGAG